MAMKSRCWRAEGYEYCSEAYEKHVSTLQGQLAAGLLTMNSRYEVLPVLRRHLVEAVRIVNSRPRRQTTNVDPDNEKYPVDSRHGELRS